MKRFIPSHNKEKHKMNKAKRKAIIAGNWKMNKTPSETTAFVKELAPVVKDAECEVVICVPFVDLQNAVEAAKGTNIHVGAENLHWKESGAYTGEISAAMLCDLGVEYVVIGHSERRQYFAETDVTVNLKIKAALAAGLKPILCVGEKLEERDSGATDIVLTTQTRYALDGVSAEDAKKIVIAYEPVWAIGTGRTATADEADAGNGVIRKTLAELYDAETAEAVTIQYGGSMNAKNAAELLSKVNVDGGLIGGASLKSADFGIIVAAAK